MRVALIVLAFALTLYALLDCARTPEEGMPARMPKFMWIVLIVLFPTVGPIAWIIVSRVKAAEERGGYVEPTVWSSREGTTLRRPERRRPLAPDENPEFLRNLEQDIRRRRHHSRPTEPGTTGRDAGGAAGAGPTGSPTDTDSPAEHRGSRNSTARNTRTGSTDDGSQDRPAGSDGAAEPGPANGNRDEDTTREP